MNIEELKSYLKENLKAPSLDFSWSEEDNRNFFRFIEESADADYLRKKENLLQIREAFASYFAPVGYILFRIKNNQIRVKVFPYTVKPEDSKNIDEIVNIICENQNAILNNYKGKNDQIYIEGRLRDAIYEYVNSIEEEQISKKELVRFSVRKALELKEEDLIILKTDCIFIKLCDSTKKRIIAKNEQNTIANRYNGIDEEEMIAFYNEHFSTKENENFFHIIAKLFVKKYLLEAKISNQDYEKKVFPYIQSIITELLINMFDNCEDFFKGFAGYVFRRHFEEVFENIAEMILLEIAASNEYIIEFLKYYSLDVIVLNGKKYKIPNLETSGELKWNVMSMLSIVKVYEKANLAIKSMQHEIDKKNAELISMFIDGLSPVEFNKQNTEKSNALTSALIKCEDDLERYYDSLQITKDPNEKKEFNEDIKRKKEEIQRLKREKKTLIETQKQRRNINKFLLLEKEIDSMNRALQKEKNILEKNSDSFKSIKTALIKALISKKRHIQ